MKKTKTNTTATADKEYIDCCFYISEKSKRIVRATLKTIDQTGTYVFLKVFKKKTTEVANFKCVQRLFLTSEEYSKLLKSGETIRVQTIEISDTVESKGNPHSICKRVRKSHLFSNTSISNTTRVKISSQNRRNYV